MDNWIALSDLNSPERSVDPDALLGAGVFVMELALPLDGATILLDYRADDGWHRTFAVFHDLAAGLVVMHRQGKSVSRHVLPGPLPVLSHDDSGTARLSFRFDALQRRWDLCFEIVVVNGAASPARVTSSGTNPLPMRLSDMMALCGGNGLAHRAAPVLWFGVTKGAQPPGRAPWVGQRTAISTSRGLVPAGHLKPGDRVHTVEDGLVPLLAVHRFDLPNRGSFAPVLLRSPFFGARQDLLVASDQMIALSGVEVEYLFGEDEVLVEAGYMVDGRTALLDHRRAVTNSVSLDFGLPTLISADGCILMCPAAPQVAAITQLPRRSLKDYEALTLMSLLGRNSQSCTA